MIHIIDAGPMIAFLNGEPGRPIMEQILIDNPGECYAHFMNLFEVYYIFLRRGGVKAAEAAMQTLTGVGIQTCYDHDETFWKEAATLKAWNNMSPPDGFCLALAKRMNGTVVTTDHGELDKMVVVNYAPILFIR